MNKRLLKNARKPSKPLYLNANLIFSECLNLIQKPWWRSHIKTNGTLNKLLDKGYSFFCSTLTRSEIIQKLKLEKGIQLKDSRFAFKQVLETYKIYVLANISKEIHLTDEFFDTFGKNNLTLGDYFHVRICKAYNLPICTHDKKLIKYCKHSEKIKLYNDVYKPEELLK